VISSLNVRCGALGNKGKGAELADKSETSSGIQNLGIKGLEKERSIIF